MRIDNFNTRKRDIDSVSRQLDEFQRRDVTGQSETLSRKLLSTETNLQQLRENGRNLNSCLSDVTTDLEMQETYRRNLSDNLEIKTKSVDLEQIRREIAQCESKIEKLEMEGDSLGYFYHIFSVSLHKQHTWVRGRGVSGVYTQNSYRRFL